MAAGTPTGSSRRGFLAGAGAVALAGAAAGCGGGADEFAGKQSQSGGDIQIVNFALTLEYLEAAFYDEVVGSGILSGRDLDVVKLVREDEHEHVDALVATAKQLKGRPADRPQTDFGSVLQNGRKGVIAAAADLENTGAAAYLGAAPNIVSAKVLKSALAIHSVEGRHASVLNHLAGRPFLSTGPLASPIDQDEALSRVQKFIV